MITLKTKSYNPEEIELLNKLMWKTISTFYKNTCERDGYEANCPTCKFKHLCADLNSCAVHTDTLIDIIAKEGKKNED